MEWTWRRLYNVRIVSDSEKNAVYGLQDTDNAGNVLPSVSIEFSRFKTIDF